MDNKVTFVHHSVPEDWDFRKMEDWSIPDWNLDIVKFISPPSSLAMWQSGDTAYHLIAMCQLVATQNLQQGRIISWVKNHINMDGYDYIWLGITAPMTYLIKVGLTKKGTAWRRWRTTWYFTYDYQNQPSTRVIVEYWDTDHWEAYSENDYTALLGDTNRIAIGHASRFNRKIYWDDTEIWIPS